MPAPDYKKLLNQLVALEKELEKQNKSMSPEKAIKKQSAAADKLSKPLKDLEKAAKAIKKG